MGGLQLDSREHFLKGGKSGPIAVPGNPDASLLVKALRYDAKPKMPPTGKLSADQIAEVETWVKGGAVWPANEAAAMKSPPYKITAEQRAFWSFQAVKAEAPPNVKAPTDIDRFLAAKLAARGLRAVKAADRRTLIRRATYDLTGLPPTAEEVDAFEHDRRMVVLPHLVRFGLAYTFHPADFTIRSDGACRHRAKDRRRAHLACARFARRW